MDEPIARQTEINPPVIARSIARRCVSCDKACLPTRQAISRNEGIAEDT